MDLSENVKDFLNPMRISRKDFVTPRMIETGVNDKQLKIKRKERICPMNNFKRLAYNALSRLKCMEMNSRVKQLSLTLLQNLFDIQRSCTRNIDSMVFTFIFRILWLFHRDQLL